MKGRFAPLHRAIGRWSGGWRQLDDNSGIGRRTGPEPAGYHPVVKVDDRDPIILKRGIGSVVGKDDGIGLRGALFRHIRHDRPAVLLRHDAHRLGAHRPPRLFFQRDGGERVNRTFRAVNDVERSLVVAQPQSRLDPQTDIQRCFRHSQLQAFVHLGNAPYICR